MISKRNMLVNLMIMVILSSVLPVAADVLKNEVADVVTYEAFGAVGDGVHDDLPAICKAHSHANAHGLPVKSKPDATYHLGRQALTAIIATDTDWSTSRFTIDDTDVENHKKSLFEVHSLLAPEQVNIEKLTRDQKRLNVRPKHDCYVLVMNNKIKRYIRRGLNRNSGTPQRDCFILRQDGSIEGNIDWDYEVVHRVQADPIDDKPLFLRGGVFTTFANRMKQEIGYNYWARNIVVKRSNTVVDSLIHYVVGETAVGHPYSGFISVSQCADITLRNCFATGHRTYKTIGAAGEPVSMGSYDYNADSVVNFTMIGCRMNDINDRSLWGVIGTNFCKNILLEDCTLSRMDTHMGVSGTYLIRRCTLGHMGLNAIGRGLLTVEDSTLHGDTFINFRSDYGSTWDGDVVIRNCRWIPSRGGRYIIYTSNDGMHDFGYPCSMPRNITIDGLFVDDSNHPKDDQDLFVLSDPDSKKEIQQYNRPFPYESCRTLRVRGLTTASGKIPRVSPNDRIRKNVVVIE